MHHKIIHIAREHKRHIIVCIFSLIGYIILSRFWVLYLDKRIVKPGLFQYLNFLVSIYTLRDPSCVRILGNNQALLLLSRMFQLILLAIVGVGSIVALVQLYMEFLAVFGDFSLVTKLFIYAILIGYIPALGLVIGYMTGLFLLGGELLDRAVSMYENLVGKYGGAKLIEILELD